jgi:hypothetical protein
LFQDLSGVGIPKFKLEDLFDGIEFPPNAPGTVYTMRTVARWEIFMEQELRFGLDFVKKWSCLSNAMTNF